MKLHLIFIGNKFIYNEALKEYVLRTVQKDTKFIDTVTYFKESDNSLFLYLEKELNSNDKIIIVSNKQNFSTVGKVICTVIEDNQVLKEGMLIPQKATLYEDRSYLLEYKGSIVNVMNIDEGENIPQLLIQSIETKATIHVFEEQKEDLVSILNPLAQTYEVNFSVTVYVDGWLRVDIDSKRYGDISKFIHAAKNLLPKKLIASANIIEHIIERLANVGKKLSFAESCTGGLLSYYFTKHNGASKILDGSLVTYSNALKENWLAVEGETLQRVGAVSAEVVEEMSEGVLNVSHADYALSISGIAGDTGGTEEKPVGTVYIGARSKKIHIQKHFCFSGDRNYVQHQSAMMAIKMLILLDKETFF
ncbi:Molybdopterin binding motif, CinA N-terminal domain / C-terminal domain of CinA type S [hydrothermal vent metagenome]|uniref:Molybdopterin binding motif, CinA N-terminal domain / C-terminal domain of CinA type S n=1 Tax=hydrothermal vent metagenome TaxID=652676 RepID=A0A1W1CWM8_9ZZZZ